MIFMLHCLIASGQAERPINYNPRSLDAVLKQDERIERLLQAHRSVVSRERGVSGFRVQISADSGPQSKLRTQRRKAEFDTRFPEVSSYIIFDSPEFKLRAGDFRTRLDASRFLEKIARDFPAAFIVVDRINFPGFD